MDSKEVAAQHMLLISSLDEIVSALAKIIDLLLQHPEDLPILKASTPLEEHLQQTNTPNARPPKRYYRGPTYFYRHIFKTFLWDAYHGEIPEYHIIGGYKSAEWLPRLDANIVQDCWAQTLKVKPIHEEAVQRMTWVSVRSSFDSYVRKLYRMKKMNQ